jgi:hypothetical protein
MQYPLIGFSTLVEILKEEQGRGFKQPLRSRVGYLLAQRNRAVYEWSGIKSFGEYAALAEAKGIVQMGGKDGYAWISLHQDSSVGQTDKHPRPEVESTAEIGPAGARHSPPEFAALVELLKKEHLKGSTQIARSTIALALTQQDKMVYLRAGVQKFSEYSALAVNAGIAQMGGIGGDAWIALHPDWRDK